MSFIMVTPKTIWIMLFPTFNNSIEKKFNYINNKNQQVLSKKDNRYRGKMYSFYKWQWDLMREDRSIEKK